jgi:hypothetical protein
MARKKYLPPEYAYAAMLCVFEDLRPIPAAGKADF